MTARSNDPLAGLTPKQIWHDCVWISDESAETKLFLLCIGRFMSADLQSSDMSYSQIRQDCSISERFAKAAAKRARDRWLRIEPKKGRLTRNGRQNLYHGIIPTDLVEQLRARKAKGLPVVVDPTMEAAADAIVDGVHLVHPSSGRDIGVQDVHPDPTDGVHGRGAPGAPVHQEAGRGAPGAPLLTKTPISLSHSNNGTPQREAPHMNGKGFVISGKHDLYIPLEIVDGWRRRFAAISDLEAAMQKLGSVIVCPEGWMAGCLAQDNQRAKDQQRKVDAEVAKAKGGSPMKTFTR